ncbi:MAG: hypothetical protein B7Z12_17780 [Caulobacter vibrioides]|uniref:Chromosome partitioning protein ParB n=1 Tax=Caulobacter vibrioides TaxID=155892 RepID=A0A258CWY9_CAUVI|nr:MAG: hypothetical protein B7Z12_17780 [Caulobacter vibrioides]
MQPLFVRPGRKGENKWMALDGRRRIYGFELLVSQGLINTTHLIDLYVCETKEQQARATVLLNSEVFAPHDADRIQAIGKLVKKKMSNAAIARALGYKEVEVKRFAALANVPAEALEAFRKDDISLEGLRLLARLPTDADRQMWAEQTLRAGWLDENRLRSIIRGATADEEDPRFSLVTQDEYLAASGRMAHDLFGELPASVLDPEILDTVWRAKVEPVAAALRERGYEVFVPQARSVQVPDGMEALPNWFQMYYVAANLKTEAHEAQARLNEIRPAIHALTIDLQDPSHLSLMVDMLVADGEMRCFGSVKRELGAITLIPGDEYKIAAGYAVKPYVAPEIEPDGDDGEDGQASSSASSRREPESIYATKSHQVATPKIKVDTAGLTHALHERQTDMGTKGLVRDLADSPNAALIVLLAQIFKGAVLGSGNNYSSDAAAKIQLTAFHSALGVEDDLDGVVRLRLKEWGQRYADSELRPIGFVESLPHGERMQLLADMTAISLDLREHRADGCNGSRRVEASEIAKLCDYNIRTHWTLRGAYLAAHPKKQQMAMLTDMGTDTAQAEKMKKTELTEFVEEQAVAKQYAPPVLDWSLDFVDSTAASDFETDEDGDEDLDGDTDGDQGDSDRLERDPADLQDDNAGDDNQNPDFDIEAQVGALMEQSGLPEHVVREQIAAAAAGIQAGEEFDDTSSRIADDVAATDNATAVGSDLALAEAA